MACRIIYANLVLTPGALIVPSSEVTALPRSALLRPVLSDVLRFQTGWTIVTGGNDWLDFGRGGTKFCTIAGGYYPTPTLFAAAIVAAFEAADPTPVWICTYASNKFTIGSDLAFTLIFGTGTHLQASAHLDLGYTGTDKGSATSQVAENVSYQSRHVVSIDALAVQASTVGVVRGHNISAAGTAVIQTTTGDTDMSAMGYANGGIAALTLAGIDPRVAYFGSTSKRYWRLLIADVQNPVGYNELGVWFAGPYLDLLGFAPEVIDEREELSEIAYAIGGVQHQVARQTRKVWDLLFRAIDAAKKVELEAFAAVVKVGGTFFFNFDIANPLNTRYVFLDKGLSFESQDTVPLTWNCKMTMREALG